MSANTIEIVRIAEAHADGFRHCLDTVARERRYLAMTQAPPADQVRAFIRHNLEHGAIQWVALDRASVVGWADLLPDWGQAVAHRGRLGMGVLPDYRRQGIGRRLLHACLEQAPEKGFTRIELEVRADNQPAIHLYEGFGFVVEAVKPNAMRFDGRYYASLQMCCLLESG